MAGGDGSQAIVAAMAAEHGLPYACIPAGTRNHFALDLGVDRDDVVGALDALVDGRERVVDLAEVNGRVFVNNVSLGLYAEAVQHEGYREAKIRTLLDTVPDVARPGRDAARPRWTGPDGAAPPAPPSSCPTTATASGRAIGSGTRPRIDDGLLGITVVGAPPGAAGAPPSVRGTWTAPEFEVDSEHPCPPASTARRCCSTRRCGSPRAGGAARADRAPAPRRVAVGRAARRAGRHVRALARIAAGRDVLSSAPSG